MTDNPTKSKVLMPDTHNRSQLGLLRGRKVMGFIAGFILTTLGITLVLQQWESVVLAFKAFIGPVLAVAGLVILFASTLKHHD